jgi:hypothetical protein
MRFCKAALATFVVVSGILVAQAATAHGSRVHLGVAIGGPAFWYYPSPYYPWPHYYYPPVVTVPATPPVYVERSDESAERPASSYWYYCPDTKTYYPYVKQCASPWQRVEPRPPG